jgi:sugar phosphate isomerase/epimerase
MHALCSRREFLERTTQSAIAIAVADHSSWAAQIARGMYVSLNSSLTRQMPWPDFVRLAGKLGYGGVDVNLNAAKTDGVDSTKALLEEAKVRPAVANLGLQFTADEAAFQEGLKLLAENASFAAAIGLNRMMAVLSPASPVPKDERRKLVKDRVSAISEVLLRSKIALGLEFLGPVYMRSNEKSPHPFIWTLNETVALAEECGPNIGVVLDVWHWHHSGGTTADIVAAGKSRIVHVHVSDAKPMPPEDVRDNMRVMPGEGVIHLVGFFRALQTAGYDAGVSPEPLGRVPKDMPAEDAARLGLETTVAVMKKAGVL